MLSGCSAQVSFLQPMAVGLTQLHPCWPSDALHLVALPRGLPPRAALVSPWKEDAPHCPWSPWHSSSFRLGTMQSHAGGTYRGHPLSQSCQSWLSPTTVGEARMAPAELLQPQRAWPLPSGGGGSSKAQHGTQQKMAAGLGREDGGPGGPAVAPVGWSTLTVPRHPGVAPKELPGPRGRFLFAARTEASALQPPPVLRFRQGLPPGAPLHYQLARCLFQDTVVKLCWAGAVIWGFLSCQPRRQIG